MPRLEASPICLRRALCSNLSCFVRSGPIPVTLVCVCLCYFSCLLLGAEKENRAETLCRLCLELFHCDSCALVSHNVADSCTGSQCILSQVKIIVINVLVHGRLSTVFTDTHTHTHTRVYHTLY